MIPADTGLVSGATRVRPNAAGEIRDKENSVSVVEQHVKIFECDGCKTQSEQEPRIGQIEGWVRFSERSEAATRLWDFCSWECASTFIEDGAPEEGGVVVEDESSRRGRR